MLGLRSFGAQNMSNICIDWHLRQPTFLFYPAEETAVYFNNLKVIKAQILKVMTAREAQEQPLQLSTHSVKITVLD